MGHTVDLNQNVYTRSSLDRRIEAVNAVEKAVTVPLKWSFLEQAASGELVSC